MTRDAGRNPGRGARASAAVVALGILALAFGACSSDGIVTAGAFPLAELADPHTAPVSETAPAAVLAADSGEATRTRFANVNFHIAPGVVLEIRSLDGVMASLTPGAPVVFDDKRSFVIRIAHAEVALDTASLGHLMNEHVFGYADAPLRHLSFGTRGGELVQRGVLHKVIDIPFEMTARVTVTPEGLMRVHPTSMKIGSLDGMGLMKAVGVHLSNLLDTHKARGVRVDRDDLLLDPVQLLPPPAIAGRVVAVRVEPGKLVQIFGDSVPQRAAQPAAQRAARRAALVPPDTAARNYMYFSGGTLHFGKLFMVHADMQIVDLNPADAFDFSIDRYNDQLVAGYSKNRPDLGIEVYMPDITRIGSAPDRTVASRTRTAQ